MEAILQRLMTEFPQHPLGVRKVLNELLETDRESFQVAAAPLLRDYLSTPGVQLLLTMLVGRDLLTSLVARLLPTDAAVAVTRRALQLDVMLDIKLARLLVAEDSRLDTAAACQLLDVLSQVTEGSRLLPVLNQLLRHSKPYLRSKAALLLGKGNRNRAWVQRQLEHAEPRVRANAVEALWNFAAKDDQDLFLEAAQDANNRVMANGLIGLYRLDCPASIPLTLELAQHRLPTYRTSAAWVMGESGDGRFLPKLKELHQETDPALRRVSGLAIEKLTRARQLAAGSDHLKLLVLETKAVQHGSVQVHFCVTGSTGQLLGPLRATSVAVWHGEQLVVDYQFRSVERPEHLHVCYLLPSRAPVAADLLLNALHQACPARSAHSDSWSAVSYSGWGSASAPRSVNSFTSSSSVLGLHADVPAGAETDLRHQLRLFLQETRAAQGHQHLVLLGGMTGEKTDFRPPDWAELLAEVTDLRATIHSILPEACTQGEQDLLQHLAAATGGYVLTGVRPRELAGVLAQVGVGLHQTYELSWILEQNSSGPTRLDVCCEQGLGERLLLEGPVVATLRA